MLIEQLPSQLDINIKQGDDLVRNINFGRDISGYTFPTSNVSLTVTNASSGDGRISWVHSLTSTLAKTLHPWYLSWVDANGKYRTLIEGKLQIL